MDFEGKDPNDAILGKGNVAEGLISIDENLQLKISSKLEDILEKQIQIKSNQGLKANKKSVDLIFSGSQSETLNCGFIERDGKLHRIKRKYVMRFENPKNAMSKNNGQNRRLKIN